MLPILVINLARRPDRLAHVATGLAALGCEFERIEAIDGQVVPSGELVARFGRSHSGRRFPATAGDMACTLSHLRAWEHIAGAAKGAAVVLEDDATLAPGFAEFCGDATRDLMRAEGIELLKLEFWPGPQLSRRYPLGEPRGRGPAGTTLYRLRSGFLGTCAYVLTSAGAQALLKRHARPRVPVDHLLFGRAAGMGFDVLSPGFVNPAPVLHDVGRFGSDIARERQEAPRTLGRRLLDWRVARSEAGELASGCTVRVEMTYAGAREGRAPQGTMVEE